MLQEDENINKDAPKSSCGEGSGACNCSKSEDAGAREGRRGFLKMGLLGAALTVTGFGLQKVFSGEKTSDESGEKVKVMTADGKLVEVDKSTIVYSKPSHSGGQIREGVPGKKFVMVIDLARCKNARKCVKGCQKMHNVIPPVEWLKVKEMQNTDLTAPYWFPTMCYQCDNPPCTKVCPVDATYKRTDGVVAIDNDRCIGCKFCMAACPYSARTFNFGNPKQVAFDKVHETDEGKCHSSDRSQVGTVSKCDFCPDSGAKGLLPSCVTSCPNGVFYYGDENEDIVSNGETVVRLSTLLKDNGAYRQFEALGTKPRVYYLPAVNRLFPFKTDTIEHNQEDEQ